MSELINLRGNLSFEETEKRILDIIDKKGFKVFGIINHEKEAIDKGISLRPVKLIIFGNPQVGSHLMLDKQTCGIDLPVKILIWTDENGNTNISRNKVENLISKHSLSANSEKFLSKISNTVKEICESAVT